jgi:hypothetical protein
MAAFLSALVVVLAFGFAAAKREPIGAKPGPA